MITLILPINHLWGINSFASQPSSPKIYSFLGISLKRNFFRSNLILVFWLEISIPVDTHKKIFAFVEEMQGS